MSVVLPTYREAARIRDTVERVRAAVGPAVGRLELIVVDDGSGDGTAVQAEAGGADLVLSHPTNRGKGAAVRTGMLAASGDVVAFTDADLAYDPSQLLLLARAIADGADVAAGSRRLASSTAVGSSGSLRRTASRVFSACVRLAVGVASSDSQCGIKAFSADAAGALFAAARVDGFAFDVEILALAGRAGMRIVEVPVSVDYAGTSTVRMAHDAPKMALDLLEVRWWMLTGAYRLKAPTV